MCIRDSLIIREYDQPSVTNDLIKLILHLTTIITAITISKKQFEFTKQRINNAKLSKLVNTRLIDYRKVKGSFDRIISIEMIEAVGEQYWPIYFKQIKNLLKPKGTAAIQVITIDLSLIHI